ncbi:apoptosis-associated speck-like protein containing a CARD [Mugil cephalus]|uniref:apoptosis-associated speck-like protein containing a CARD n=1 Tax=Mugil cephalus TaxID=48193 RepID=UPI001FB5DD36|nr:apoptosis-associated speck-like protein containing a CARD [Mugil cephalus]
MARKNLKFCLADALEDLGQQDFKKFVHRLRDRRIEPRVPLSKVEGKGFLEVTDVLVSHFTDKGAVDVAVEILRSIGCNEAANALVRETSGGP